MKIAITVCATGKYSHALISQARRVQACCRNIEKGWIILATNNPIDSNRIKEAYKKLMPNWEFLGLVGKIEDGHKSYKEDAQLVIGQLRTMAFCEARSLNVDYCWSLDSDVLPPANALDCSLEMLAFDNGYYGISACPYPSQGGGGFLCGRGTIYRPILEDWIEEERVIPKELEKKLKEARSKIEKYGKEKIQDKLKEAIQELQGLDEEVKKCNPKGNVFEMNAKNWRRRGWMDQAYPAIGKGSIVPCDWCGFGCTLMNKEALAIAHFDGYDGKGTEDLYIVWHRWHQAGLKINAIAHCPCDHVIRNPGKKDYFVLQQSYHETEGECVGHLRIRSRPFYNFDPGEKYNEENDGKMVNAEEKKDVKPELTPP